ncbi:MAG TPA: non-canonical purine NTP pyrophosphatase [Candidatus Moranbacteria bacterium]|nr:MAG: Non-canonical purine NTP pyrophosphatase [Candidatus Moranbacteria bacterium GW2011_GWC2_45_10]KKT95558.1 MAG: Non-canonical purine NTP pyrophosphatase [Parcubacteria group bacterium GW2011_GWC1_45_14]HAV11035.1 non-canonical purine NTP pyrophosphatase [Candidatus Moranbacteria bacterium]
MKILIGTTNKDKFTEYEKAFEIHGKDIEIVSVNDLNITGEVEEDGKSLLENARKKAKYFGEKSGMFTVSEDFGLFVDALGGEPGIHAKRWHGGTEADRRRKLLERLSGVSGGSRKAEYRGVMVGYDPGRKAFWEYEGAIRGRIREDGDFPEGFGYDPIFISDFYGKSFSDTSKEEKLAISHRGLGVRGLVGFLKSHID